MNSNIQLTNGAANWAFQLLSTTTCSMEDLFSSGSLSLKFKPAATLPFMQSDETQQAYKARIETWLDAPFMCVNGDEGHCINVTEGERDYMRKLLKEKGKASQLPGVYHVANLARAFDLDKP